MDETGFVYSKIKTADTAHTRISACVTRPLSLFFRKGLGMRLSAAYSHNKLEVLAKTSKVYQLTNLVNFSLSGDCILQLHNVR